MSEFKLDIRVDYVDTDAMGIVHHASYFRWLERARVEWLRASGLSYAKLEAEGYFLPLLSAEIQYHQPLRFDDRATILLSIGEFSKSRIPVHYKVFCEDRLTTSASTVHVLMKKSNKVNEAGSAKESASWRPIAIPEEWKNLWQSPNVRKP